MATASKIHLEPTQQPAFYVKGISAESAEMASRLLQENHDKYHIFFNQSGFHNHIAHHLLTLFALNASPAELKKAYDDNASYQRPPVSVEQSVVEDMHLKERYKTYLGDEKYYHDFLVFFQDEIEKLGWERVLNEYVFKGDERADDMLVRMFAGFLHPIIHLGFGIEFRQPAIIAEALAQAAVHESWIGAFFFGCEDAARANSPDGRPLKSIVQLLDEIHASDKFAAGAAAHWDDGNKIRDGVLKRAKEEIVAVASQYDVLSKDLEEKTAEMINAAVYFTSTAQRPPHMAKFDFYYMHCVNSSLFFSTFLSLPPSILPPSSQSRLLAWKVRLDLAMYASRGSPALLLADVASYTPKQPSPGWNQVFARVRAMPDDGHAAKLVRAIAHGERVCEKWEARPGFRIQGEVWAKLGHMAVDSVEGGGDMWIRNAGFEEAWKDVPLRQDAEARL